MNAYNFYEAHNHKDPSFPIIYHLDTMRRYQSDFIPHWHENLELLCVLQGTINVLMDAASITANQGEIIIVNSNNVHYIQSLAEESKYYCLIIDQKLFEELHLDIGEVMFHRLIRDHELEKCFHLIYEELQLKKDLYKAKIMSTTVDIIIRLYRDYILQASSLSRQLKNDKVEVVKKAIRYIQRNYAQAISISSISDELGMSKYYFCHIFKEITGYTMVSFLNIVRCSNAKKLLQTGKYSVEEAALLCGFDNMSYFSKTYKKYMDCLPSTNIPRV